MLVVNDLADQINTAIGAKDAHGNPISATSQMKTYAKAIIDTLKAGLVNNAPGTVNAVGAPAAPITAGTAIGGLISGLLPATWIGDMTSGFPGANAGMISSEATASTGYLMVSSLVAFATGTITGTCTATPISPGILAAGAGSNGMISGLTGIAWTAAVISGFPGANPVLSKKIYNAISMYIEAQAVAAYATGTVVGAFSAGGGPLTAGAGIGGTIQ